MCSGSLLPIPLDRQHPRPDHDEKDVFGFTPSDTPGPPISKTRTQPHVIPNGVRNLPPHGNFLRFTPTTKRPRSGSLFTPPPPRKCPIRPIRPNPLSPKPRPLPTPGSRDPVCRHRPEANTASGRMEGSRYDGTRPLTMKRTTGFGTRGRGYGMTHMCRPQGPRRIGNPSRLPEIIPRDPEGSDCSPDGAKTQIFGSPIRHTRYLVVRRIAPIAMGTWVLPHDFLASKLLELLYDIRVGHDTLRSVSIHSGVFSATSERTGGKGFPSCW